MKNPNLTRSKVLILAFGVFTLLFAAALWYAQTRAYYHDVTADSVTIGGVDYAVTDYRGIDADTSPLKMRACFTLAQDVPAPDTPEAPDAHPLVAPPQFACFNAADIDRDLENGTARAILAARNAPYGFDRYIARYPDGRAYMWRQINDCGAAVFAGDPLPETCPPKPEAE